MARKSTSIHLENESGSQKEDWDRKEERGLSTNGGSVLIARAARSASGTAALGGAWLSSWGDQDNNGLSWVGTLVMVVVVVVAWSLLMMVVLWFDVTMVVGGCAPFVAGELGNIGGVPA